MSIARITVVKAARKPQGKCESCGVAIKVGDPYLHYTVGFRSTYKHVRCTNHGCYPPPSLRESSKLSAVYAAQEDAERSIGELDNPDSLTDDIEGILSSLADEIRSVAEEYREASVNPNTGVTFNTDAEERADTLDGAADELESWSSSVDDKPEEDEDADGNLDTSTLDDWIEEVKNEAIEAINNVELP